MGIIEVEFEFGKSYADKIIIWIFQVIVYYIYHYFRLLLTNFLKFRSKSKIPSFTSIDLTKLIFPITLISIGLPVLVFFLVLIFNSGNTGDSGTYVISALSLALISIIVYLAYKVILDIIVSSVCLLISFIVTTIYAIRYLIRKKD